MTWYELFESAMARNASEDELKYWCEKLSESRSKKNKHKYE